MKSMMMLLLLASAPAMAVSLGDYSSEQAPVNYLSWCDGNSVIAQDHRGELYVRANCDDKGLLCKAQSYHNEQGSISMAACGNK